MSPFYLPFAADTFLKGLEAGDAELLLSVMHDDAVLSDGFRQYRGSVIREWAHAYLAGRPLGARVVNRHWNSGRLALTILAPGGHAAKGGELFHWHLDIKTDRITQVKIERALLPDVPPAVSRFISAVNEGDAEGIVRSFSEDALVNDELVDYWGLDQIRAWAERDVIGKRLAFYVVATVLRAERVVLTCHATGNFDGLGLPDPLVLSLYLSIQGDRIGQLIVLQSQQAN